ncbi:hypothetical protein EJB05_01886, partial [Eragrostis curvula]
MHGHRQGRAPASSSATLRPPPRTGRFPRRVFFLSVKVDPGSRVVNPGARRRRVQAQGRGVTAMDACTWELRGNHVLPVPDQPSLHRARIFLRPRPRGEHAILLAIKARSFLRLLRVRRNAAPRVCALFWCAVAMLVAGHYGFVEISSSAQVVTYRALSQMRRWRMLYKAEWLTKVDEMMEAIGRSLEMHENQNSNVNNVLSLILMDDYIGALHDEMVDITGDSLGHAAQSVAGGSESSITGPSPVRCKWRQQKSRSLISQHLKTMCYAKLGWRLATRLFCSLEQSEQELGGLAVRRFEWLFAVRWARDYDDGTAPRPPSWSWTAPPPSHAEPRPATPHGAMRVVRPRQRRQATTCGRVPQGGGELELDGVAPEAEAREAEDGIVAREPEDGVAPEAEARWRAPWSAGAGEQAAAGRG